MRARIAGWQVGVKGRRAVGSEQQSEGGVVAAEKWEARRSA